uniref:SWIM-type domain-containing protein n=1 Tax=Vitis vinifera TaxID=29760 RepID=A5BMR9_VITVI|nr:hypothetical protein VITISV_023349 [Vitis vinifera]
MKMHYTLKFNPRVIQDLEDEDDLDKVVSHSDDFANVYLVDLPCVEAIEANIPNTELAIGEYTPLESIRFREAILGLGHTFTNAEEFRNAIYQMSLGGRFEYKYKKNSPTHMSVKCSVEGCPWKITAHAVEGNVILRVHIYQVNHNHIAQNECSSKVKVSSKRGAVVVEDVFRTTPDYLPRQICKNFERDHGVQLTYNQVWHLKEKAKERIYGAPRESYTFVPWLCHRLKEINPDTIAEYTSDEGHFMQLFIAYAFTIQGFIKGCRPVLAIDSCHLSGPYKGALLFAIAYDADDGMFLLAFGVVSSENYEDWYWFLEKLKGVLDGKEIIFDRHQGILRSVSELFGIGNHAYCYRHVKENFSSFLNKQNIRGKKGKEGALLLLDSIAYARLEIDYNEVFEKLVRFNDNLGKWVAKNNPEHWAMSKFLKKRWDKMTSNIAESFNAWLRDEHHQTIYTLLLMHMDKLVAMLDTHMRGTQKWKSVVGPKTEEKLMSNIMRSGLISMLPYLGGTFNVFTGEVYLVVDINQRTCTCMTWQMFGLPCSHPTRLFTRCSSSRFLKLCNRLPVDKLEVVRDLQFGGLLNLNCKEIRHNICLWLIDHFNVGFRRIDISFDKSYDLTTTDVDLVFGLSTSGRILQIASTPSEHPFGTLNTCEERLFDLPVGEEFRRCFLYYTCATILAPTSRIDGCRNLWHTINEDVPFLSAWSDELIKERLAAEISQFGSFGHGEGFDNLSPPRTHVESDSGPTSSHVRILFVTLRINSVWMPLQLADEEVVVLGKLSLHSMVVAPSDRREAMKSASKMVMCSNAKHLMHDTVIGRFEPYLYPLDVSYQNVNEVYLSVLLKNHWKLYVYDLHNKRIQLLDSRPGRRRSCMSGIQQNLTNQLSQFPSQSDYSACDLQRRSTAGGPVELLVGLSFEIPWHFDKHRLQGFWVFSLGNLLSMALQQFHGFAVGFKGYGLIFGTSDVCIRRPPHSAHVKGGFSPVPFDSLMAPRRDTTTSRAQGKRPAEASQPGEAEARRKARFDIGLFTSMEEYQRYKQKFAQRKHFNFEGLFVRMGWLPLVTISKPIFPTLVRAFYSRVTYRHGRPIVSTVRGVQIKLDPESICRILDIAPVGLRAATDIEVFLIDSIMTRKRIDVGYVMMMHMMACCESSTRVLPYGRFLTRVFKDARVDLSREQEFEAPSSYDTYDEQSLGRMKFEKGPDGSWIRKVERLVAHLAIEEEVEIGEMEGGVAPQKDYEHTQTKFDIHPPQFEGCQLGATLSGGVMSEAMHTTGTSSQPSFTDPPHAHTSPHQAPYDPSQTPWMDLGAQISSLGTQMEELAVVNDMQFYSMEDRMDHYQTGFTEQFQCMQQRFQSIEDRMDQQQATFEHIL